MAAAPDRRHPAAWGATALALLRSPLVKALFFGAGVLAAVWVVAGHWVQVSAALARVQPTALLMVLVLSAAHVVATMLAWRALLADLGSPLGVREAGALFFLTQVGKYLPGGVWNVVAVAEMGAARRIPRRRMLTVMIVWWLVTILTGLMLAVTAGPLAPGAAAQRLTWTIWLLPIFMTLSIPPVLNRVVRRSLAVLRRPPLEHDLSWAGLLRASGWGLIGWLLAGTQVAMIAHAVGMPLSATTFAWCLGGYALAWTVGFLVVVAPAGAGVREAVLGLALAGVLDTGSVTVTVLLSRIGITAADVGWALVSAAARRRTDQL